jgi:hypothetical protein
VAVGYELVDFGDGAPSLSLFFFSSPELDLVFYC